ncbi:MAG: hypothetical protein ACPIB4_04600 [Candidatus Puniceispirillaceae bacterium]
MGNNYRHINQITLFTIGAMEPPCLFRIIDNIKIQPLTYDDTFQYVGSGIAKVMRLAPSQIGNKTPASTSKTLSPMRAVPVPSRI